MFSRISAVLFLLPCLAWGFTFLTEGMRGWEKKEVRFYFNSDNCPLPASEIEEAIERGVNLWNSVPTSDVKLNYAGQTSQTGLQEEPIVDCVTSGLDDSLAITSVTTVSGRIATAQIEINAEVGSDGNIENYRGDRLALVVAHEMGHAMGLGHSASQSSLMYFSIGRKEHLALASDDMDGMAFLYPRREPEDGFLGCGSLGGAGASGGGGGLLGVLSLLGVVTLLLRGRGAAPRRAEFA